MTADAPRSALWLAARGDVERANEEIRARGLRSRVGEDIHEEVGQAATTRRASRAQLRRWLLHPDERVLMALLGNSRRPWQQARRGTVLFHVLARAVPEALDGPCWSPLLDWAAHQAWPEPRELRRLAEEERVVADSRLFAAGLKDYMVERASTYAAQATDEEVARFFAFHSYPLLNAVTRERTQVSDWLLDCAWTSARRSVAVGNLLRADDIRPEQVRRIQERAVDELTQATGALVARAGDCSQSTLLGLDRRGTPVPDEMVERLLTFAESRAGGFGKSSRRYRVALMLAHCRSSGTPDQMLRLYRLAGKHTPVTRGILSRTVLAQAVLREIAQDTSEPALRTQAARRARRAGDRETWDALSRSRTYEVELSVLDAGTPRAFRRVFRRWTGEYAKGKVARERLRARWGDVGAIVRRRDLLPLALSGEGEMQSTFGLLARASLLETRGPDFARSFAALARMRPADAAAVLEHVTPEQRSLLRRRMLTPLLAASERRAREAAVRNIGSLLDFAA